MPYSLLVLLDLSEPRGAVPDRCGQECGDPAVLEAGAWVAFHMAMGSGEQGFVQPDAGFRGQCRPWIPCEAC